MQELANIQQFCRPVKKTLHFDSKNHINSDNFSTFSVQLFEPLRNVSSIQVIDSFVLPTEFIIDSHNNILIVNDVSIELIEGDYTIDTLIDHLNVRFTDNNQSITVTLYGNNKLMFSSQYPFLFATSPLLYNLGIQKLSSSFITMLGLNTLFTTYPCKLYKYPYAFLRCDDYYDVSHKYLSSQNTYSFLGKIVLSNQHQEYDHDILFQERLPRDISNFTFRLERENGDLYDLKGHYFSFSLLITYYELPKHLENDIPDENLEHFLNFDNYN